MPLKRHAAAVIGGFLHEVLAEGRAPAVAAREAGLVRQTASCWLKQFGLMYVAHLTVHVPQLSVPAGIPPAVRSAGLRSARGCLLQVWCVLLALAARRLPGVAAAELPRHLLVWLQPELSRLRPVAGVFRVPLHERARGPPGR